MHQVSSAAEVASILCMAVCRSALRSVLHVAALLVLSPLSGLQPAKYICDATCSSIAAHMEEVIAHLLCLPLSHGSELRLQDGQGGQRQGPPQKLQAKVAVCTLTTQEAPENRDMSAAKAASARAGQVWHKKRRSRLQAMQCTGQVPKLGNSFAAMRQPK